MGLPFYQILGYLGTIPFWVCTIALWTGASPFEAASLFLYQAAYAGFILSFLGGVHWAHALPRGNHVQMALAMAPTIFALLTLFLPFVFQGFGWPLLLVALAFIALYILDLKMLEAKWLAEGYMKFRLILTGIVCASLIASAAWFLF